MLGKLRKLLEVIGVIVLLGVFVWRFSCMVEEEIYVLPREVMGVPDFEDVWVIGSGIQYSRGMWSMPEEVGDYSVICIYKGLRFVRYNIKVVDYVDKYPFPNNLVVGDIVEACEDYPNLRYEYDTSDSSVVAVSGDKVSVVGSGSCSLRKVVNDTQSYSYNIKIEKPSMKDVSLYKGESLKMNILNGSNSSGWSSSDNDIVSVDKDGVIKALKLGKAEIKAKVGNLEVTSNVTVSKNPKMNKKELDLVLGGSEIIKVSNVIGNVKWSSSDDRVATVNSEGKVMGVGYGRAVISADIRSKRVKCKVNVLEPKFSMKSYSVPYGETVVVELENCPKGDIEWSVEGDSVMVGDTSNEGILRVLQENFVENELRVCKEITEYVRLNGFSYGNASRNPAMGSVDKLVSCDRFVGWVLYDLGYRNQPVSNGLFVYSGDSNHDLASFCERHGFTRINTLGECKAGDIMFQGFNGGFKHTYILGHPVANGLWQRYDCGMNQRIWSVQPSVESKCTDFSFAYRPKACIESVKVECKDNQIAITGVSKGNSVVKAKVGNLEMVVDVVVE